MIPKAVMAWAAAFALIVPLVTAGEADLVSRTIWGEARGCPQEEREAVAWCVMNRVEDERFPDTIEEVVTAPNRFAGYSPSFPAGPFLAEARDVILRHRLGERGIDPSLVWFTGDGVHNNFRSEY